MLVTLDTNVVYQALRSSSGASFAILQLIRNGEIGLALSHAVLLEYEAVLQRDENRKAFELSSPDVEKVLRFIAFISKKFEPRFLFRPNLPDEDDNIFVELAVVSQSRYIITKNTKDYRRNELKFDSFRILTPSEFMSKWRR